MSPYEVLGVDPQASPAAIRAAYLRRAREVHPDVVADADEATRARSEEQMRQLNEAWHQLSSTDGVVSSRPTFTAGEDVTEDLEADLAHDLDEPIGEPPSGLARTVTAIGPLLLVLSVVTIGFGLLFLAAPLMVAGFIGVAIALSAFLMAPLLTMSSARRDRQGRPSTDEGAGMSKVGVIAKLTTVEGKRDEVVEILASRGVPLADGEPGTEIYAAHVDAGDDVTIWYYELYTDEAALAEHGKNPGMKDVGAALGGLLAGRPEIHVLSPFAAKGLDI